MKNKNRTDRFSAHVRHGSNLNAEQLQRAIKLADKLPARVFEIIGRLVYQAILKDLEKELSQFQQPRKRPV